MISLSKNSKKVLIQYLFASRGQGFPSPDYEFRPFMNAYSVLREEFGNLLDTEMTTVAFSRAIKICGIDRKSHYSDADAENFANAVLQELHVNVKNHQTCIPLIGAHLSEEQHFGKMHFLPGNRYRSQAWLIKKAGLGKKEAGRFLLTHRNDRRYRVLNQVLLVVDRKHVSDAIQDNANFQAEFLTSAVILLGIPNPPKFSVRARHVERREIRHLLVNGPQSFSYRYPPMGFDLLCKVDLDLIFSKENIRFLQYIVSLTEKSELSDLELRILRCLRFIARAQDSSEFSDRNLFLTIAAEALFLSGETGKRISLALRLSEIVAKNDDEYKEIFNAIDSVYRHRNDYLHSGIERPRLWNLPHGRGQNQIDSEKFGLVLAETALRWSTWSKIMTGRSRNASTRVHEWIAYLQRVQSRSRRRAVRLGLLEAKRVEL